MHPRDHALVQPNKPALIMAASGVVTTYEDLDKRSSQCAHLFRSEGLAIDDPIAILMHNHPRFLEVCWSAQRSGLVYTPISTHLTPNEIEYILRDCGAKALIASAVFAEVAAQAVFNLPASTLRYSVDGSIGGFTPLESAIEPFPSEPIADELEGVEMLYSSGTTGQPKGIRHQRGDRTIGTPTPATAGLASGAYGFDADTLYLSPAPMYHSAPLRFAMALQRIGATVVIMEKFDPKLALQAIERYSITHSQWVPTMFTRMLKLPAAERQAHDLSSMQIALHAAAPCPVHVKRAMIEWWGPILFEYYGATEGNGATAISSEDWLQHPGSVGKALNCTVHIIDDDGKEVPSGQVGTVFFSGSGKFSYHNDPDKTADAYNQNGWSTVGDVGYLDDDGYLYLTDRKANMIISGGVNIYPQEAENVLVEHDMVLDVAVFGIPNDEYGEEVKAVIELIDFAQGSPELETELLEYCRARLAKIKCPRSIDFERKLPRSDTGKLYKRRLRQRYWKDHATGIL